MPRGCTDHGGLHVPEWRGKAEGVDPEHIDLIQQVLDGEIAQLHGQYLERRNELRDACISAEQSALSVFRPRRALTVGTALAVSGLVYGYGGRAWQRAHEQRRA